MVQASHMGFPTRITSLGDTLTNINWNRFHSDVKARKNVLDLVIKVAESHVVDVQKKELSREGLGTEMVKGYSGVTVSGISHHLYQAVLKENKGVEERHEFYDINLAQGILSYLRAFRDEEPILSNPRDQRVAEDFIDKLKEKPSYM